MTPFQILDAILIAPFRLPGPPEAGFLFGILALAVASAALGKAGTALVSRVQRVRQEREEAEAAKRSELSYKALQQGDKKAYLAQNNLAQEAYGNTLALSAGRGAALLWPACGALTWLSWRFDGVPMPLLWRSASPASYFIPLFLLALLGLHYLLRKKNAAPPDSPENAASPADEHADESAKADG